MNVIRLDIIDKSNARWTIVGSCPEAVAASGGLYAYRGKNARVVDSLTDQVIVTGRSLHNVAQRLADTTGLPVELTDELANTRRVFTPKEAS